MLAKRFVLIVIAFFCSSVLVAQNHPKHRQVPSQERIALLELFKATSGEHWTKNVGWKGAEGTECDWYGVQCELLGDDREQHVTGLDLENNNLVGSVPSSLTELHLLMWLNLHGNKIAGKLPETVITKFLSGDLHFIGESGLVTDISAVDMEVNPSALLCGDRRTRISSDLKVTQYIKRCRNASRDDRVTYCEVRHGQTWLAEYTRLAAMIERNGFKDLKKEYDRNITDGTFVSTHVTSARATQSVVNYANAAPLNLWAIEKAIEGLASQAEWERPSKVAECPRWSDSER